MTNKTMTLSGDNNIPAMPVTEANVNHLRRLLAWMRCEYALDEDMQRGYMLGIEKCVENEVISQEQAGRLIDDKAAQINQVPAYVRQAHKMLSKAIREHDKKSGVIDAEA